MKSGLIIGFENIRDFTDRHKGFGINGLNDIAHFGNLKTIYDKIDNRFFCIGIPAGRSDFSRSTFKFLQQRIVDLLGFFGDDHHRFASVKTFYDTPKAFMQPAMKSITMFFQLSFFSSFRMLIIYTSMKSQKPEVPISYPSYCSISSQSPQGALPFLEIV